MLPRKTKQHFYIKNTNYRKCKSKYYNLLGNIYPRNDYNLTFTVFVCPLTI